MTNNVRPCADKRLRRKVFMRWLLLKEKQAGTMKR